MMKFYKKWGLEANSSPILSLWNFTRNLWWKIKFLKQTGYIGYVRAICNYKNVSKEACILPQIPFYWGFSKNAKGPGTSFQATWVSFVALFDKNFHIVILHKLVKFHYQTVFTWKVIQFYKMYFLFCN